MPGVCRGGVDVHACGDLDLSGSNVYVDGSPVHRFSDGHSHGGTQVGCSPTTFANGLGFARLGDNHSGDPLIVISPIHAPNPEVTASGDVFADG